MNTCFAVKTTQGALIPADSISANTFDRFQPGAVVCVEIKQKRNAKFHRKFFALLNVAYDMLDQSRLQSRYKEQDVFLTREKFREDVTILAGHCEIVMNINGEFRYKAKSISFSKMDDLAFDAFYNRVIDVLLDKVLTTKCTAKEIDDAVNKLLNFD